MHSVKIESRLVVTLLAIDASEVRGRTVASVSLQHVDGSLWRTRTLILHYEGRYGRLD